MKLRLVSAALLLIPIFGGCSCEDDPLTPAQPGSKIDAGFFVDTGAVFPDASDDAGVEPPDSGPPDTGVPEARVLTFDGTSPISVYFNVSRDLRFLLRTASGAIVAGETVRFTLAGNGGAVNTMSATTDVNGFATILYTAGPATGQSVITAEADRAPSIMVTINVGEDPSADLELNVRSNARITVMGAEALLYIGATPPTCAQLYGAAMLPAATLTASFNPVPGTRTFNMLQSGSVVTAYATGTNARGDVVARGCVEGTRLMGGTTTRIDVALDQLPSNLTGDYDALLQVDLGAGLPPPYGPTIVTITDLLSDPAGWAVYQTLAAIDTQLGTTFVQWTPPGGTMQRRATFDEVRSNANIFNTWRIASNALDNFLVMQLGQPYIDVTNVGADISHVIREFEIGAGYTITSTGVADRLQVVESWKALVFQWQLGCPNGDLGCARRAVQLSGANANLAPLQATYGASVVHAPSTTPPPGETERFQLLLDAHAINLRYGAVILLVLNQIVFPNLPPPLNGNNLTQVIGNIVNCPDVAIALGNATGFPPQVFQALCDSAVAAAANAIEMQLLALDSNNNPGLFGGAGPAGGGEMFLVDGDHDLRTELVPQVLTYAAWRNASGTSTPINAPITGDGRKAASACRSDADCAPNACAPVGSYLKVRAVEHDCRRPIGMTAGAVGCAQDVDCASGLCFDPGTGVRVCYSACQGAAACALGTCTPNAARVDLDPLLAGLGDGAVAACVP